MKVSVGTARADSLGLSRPAVMDEHVVGLIAVAGDEIAGGRVERDEPSVGADRQIERTAVASVPSEATSTRSIDASPPVEHVDVVEEVRVPVGNEPVGKRSEGHEPAVRADRRGDGSAAGRQAVKAAADELRRASAPIANEDVRGPGHVTHGEVRGLGGEGDEAPVGADVRGAQQREEAAVAVSLLTPSGPTLTRSILSVARSRTKMSDAKLVSSGTRLSAREANATYRPSALIDARSLSLLPCAPSSLTLINSKSRDLVWSKAAGALRARPGANVMTINMVTSREELRTHGSPFFDAARRRSTRMQTDAQGRPGPCSSER